MRNIDILKAKMDVYRDVFKPILFRLNIEEDKKDFEGLLQKDHIYVHDELYGQLKELVKCRNPKRALKDEDYEALISRHLDGRDIFEYGVWLHYPWNNRLVHTLDKEEFIEARTSRNQYKITNTERDLLATKKVGIIGLSVGQSVSLALAMERGCGELRLADFDELELTNYNRIRTGLHNLGLKKVTAVAREIMEIDPYLEIKVFPEGISEENIGDFIGYGADKLDLLIDECDSVDIKILCRIKAKEQQIPVVMEASDRGTIDVERFDLEPDRPILHGKVAHLDLSKLKHLRTSEEKVPYMLPISGIETLSTRMKSSMLEIGQTITTWPQLASAVALGGGITADVCRRIFLNEYHDSGRYFIDIEDLICDKVKEQERHEPEFSPALTTEEADRLIEEARVSHAEHQEMLSETDVATLVGAAIQAPTGGNAQPWLWKYSDGCIYLFLNEEYKTQLIDYNNTASFIGFGAASENLVLKAHELGYEVNIVKLPLGNESKLICAFRFFKENPRTLTTEAHGVDHLVEGMCLSSKRTGIFFKENPRTLTTEAHGVDHLVEAIPYRTANRLLTERQPIQHERLQRLANIVATVPGAHVSFLTGEQQLSNIAEVIALADKLRIMHKGGHLDFLAEMVWTDEEALQKKRGLDINTLDLTPTEKIGFGISREWGVIEKLNKWNAGSGLEKFSRKSALMASAIGLITMPGTGKENFYDGGRAVERLWLAATADNIAFQPLSVSTFLFNRYLTDGKDAFPESIAKVLEGMRRNFEQLFDLKERRSEILLFRLFITDVSPKRSLRVPVEEVLLFNEEKQVNDKTPGIQGH